MRIVLRAALAALSLTLAACGHDEGAGAGGLGEQRRSRAADATVVAEAPPAPRA